MPRATATEPYAQPSPLPAIATMIDGPVWLAESKQDGRGMVILPGADQRDVTEYYTAASQASAPSGWLTRIASFRLPGC